jgi:DNA repair protein RadC
LVEYHPTVKQLPVGERPRERLRDLGPSSLSNAELLAILLRVGSTSENVIRLAERLLAQYGGLEGLIRASFAELCGEHGMGEAKAAQVKAALEVGRRLVSMQVGERVVVKSPLDVANLLLLEMGLLEQEHLRVVLLNTKNQVLAIPEIYKGSLNTSLVRIGELFREAVRQNCAAVVVVHNHPSGDPTPSDEDVRMTREMVQAGNLLGIEVLDHLVIGQQRYVSLKEQGLGFE